MTSCSPPRPSTHPSVQGQIERRAEHFAAVAQVGDRLEQRNDVDLPEQARPRAAARPTSSRSDTRRAVRDHVVRHRARAEAPPAFRGRGEDRELVLAGTREYSRCGTRSGRGPGELLHQQRHARGFVQGRVIWSNRRALKQLARPRLRARPSFAAGRSARGGSRTGSLCAAGSRGGRGPGGPAPCFSSESEMTARSASEFLGVRIRRPLHHRRRIRLQLGQRLARRRRAARRCPRSRGGTARRAGKPSSRPTPRRAPRSPGGAGRMRAESASSL